MLAFRFCVVVSAGAIAILGYRADASALEMPLAIKTEFARAVSSAAAPEVALKPAASLEPEPFSRAAGEAPQPALSVSPQISQGSAAEAEAPVLAQRPVDAIDTAAPSPVIEPAARPNPTAPVNSEVILDAFKSALNEAGTAAIAEAKPALSTAAPEAVLMVETTPDRAPKVLEVFKNTIARFEGVEHAIVTENPTEPDRPVSTAVSPAFASTQGVPFDRILERFRNATNDRASNSVLPSEQAIPVSEHLLNPERRAIEAPAPVPVAGNNLAAQTVLEAFAALSRDASSQSVREPATERPVLAQTKPFNPFNRILNRVRQVTLSPPETQPSAEFSTPVPAPSPSAVTVASSEPLPAAAAILDAFTRAVEQETRSPAPQNPQTVTPVNRPPETTSLGTTLDRIEAGFVQLSPSSLATPGADSISVPAAETPAPSRENEIAPSPPALPQQPFAPFSRILDRFKAYQPSELSETTVTARSTSITQSEADFNAPSPRSVLNAFQQVIVNPPAPNSTPTPELVFQSPSPPVSESPSPPVSQSPSPVLPPSAPAEAQPIAPQPAASLSGLDSPAYLDGSPNPLLFPARPEDVQIDINKPISLQEAIELARRNNPTLQGARLELDVAREQLREALAAEYPTLSTQFNLTRTDSAQQDLSNQNQNPLLNQNSGTINTTADARLELSYDLLTGGRRTAQINAAEEQIRLRQLNAETLAEQTRFDVTSNYYDLQEADARVDIERAAVADATQTLRDAQLLEQAGLGTRFDVLRAQVDLANSQQNLATAQSQQVISRRTLASILGINQQANISAADPIERSGQWELPLEETIVLAFRNRAELQQQIVQRNISEQQREVALSALRPQVSLFANYNMLGLLNDNRGLGDGYTVGARLQWTLFEGGAAGARAAQQEKNMELAASRFDDQRNKVRLEVEQAYNNIQASETNIQTANVALQLAQESLRLARLRFSAGVGTQTEVINAQTELTKARGNLLTAIINYNRSLAALQRAVSNLPDDRLFDIENNW